MSKKKQFPFNIDMRLYNRLTEKLKREQELGTNNNNMTRLLHDMLNEQLNKDVEFEVSRSPD